MNKLAKEGDASRDANCQVEAGAIAEFLTKNATPFFLLCFSVFIFNLIFCGSDENDEASKEHSSLYQ